MRYIQAKAALQAGLRKGNARERPVVSRHEKESHAHRSSGVNSQDVQRYFQVYLYPCFKFEDRNIVPHCNCFFKIMFFILVRV